MRERDIMHEAGAYWVLAGRGHYSVMSSGVTHSESESSYAMTPDGLSIAKARTDYLHAKSCNASGSRVVSESDKGGTK